MDHSPDRDRSPRSVETMLRQAASFHDEHASELGVPHQAAAATHRRWIRPVLAAAAVAVLVASVVVATQWNRTDGTAVAASADQRAFRVVDSGPTAGRCNDQQMTTVVVPGTVMDDFHAEAGFSSNSSLCVETFGANPRGSMVFGPADRRDGPVPFFQAAGFVRSEVDQVLTMDWLAVGAVGPQVEAIRFVPDAVGSVQWIDEVASSGDYKVFGLPFTTAGRVEFLRAGTVIATEKLPEPTLRQTMSTELPAPTGPPCADTSHWEWNTEVPVQQAQDGDRATAAHDSRSAMGQHFLCLRLSTTYEQVELWTGPVQVGVYSAVNTYETGGARFLIVQTTAVVARLDISIGDAEAVTYNADDMGRDEAGYATLISRIPLTGDISLRAYDATGQLINVPAPAPTTPAVVDNP